MDTAHWQNKSDWTKGAWQKKQKIPLVGDEHRVGPAYSRKMAARLALLPIWDETLPEEMLVCIRHPGNRVKGFFRHVPGMPHMDHLTSWEELNRAASLLSEKLYGYPIRLREQKHRPAEWELEIVGYVADSDRPDNSWVADSCIRHPANWVTEDHTVCFRGLVGMDRRSSTGLLIAFIEDCCAASPWVYARPLGLRWSYMLGMTDAEYQKEMAMWKNGEAQRIRFAPVTQTCAVRPTPRPLRIDDVTLTEDGKWIWHIDPNLVV